ncbi:hypothetical protein OS242_18750 [Tumebacillus sp. DT12]|uniref:PepSY domain-containing protein n=1 Tax=Tumebacillus lacus TaxID=2995335 RepID=A0ABT3X503_9BACL|nr:hypothetical protein [Tumebacillus lacus]MCX7571981.1 hypothetical protein [Tumebacillus lacus]
MMKKITIATAALLLAASTLHITGKMLAAGMSIEAPTSPGKIKEREALESAKQQSPGWARDAKEVKVEYHLMTNKRYQGFSEEALEKNANLKANKHMNKTPVYIVSFIGMEYEVGAPIKYKGEKIIHHEYNVVVDATTGVPLMGFSHR